MDSYICYIWTRMFFLPFSSIFLCNDRSNSLCGNNNSFLLKISWKLLLSWILSSWLYSTMLGRTSTPKKLQWLHLLEGGLSYQITHHQHFILDNAYNVLYIRKIKICFNSFNVFPVKKTTDTLNLNCDCSIITPALLY